MKIAIITFHKAYNCGAMLQAWALQKTLTALGHEVSFPSCNRVGQGAYWRVKHIPKEKRGVQRLRSFVGRLWLDFKARICYNPFKRHYDAFRHEYLSETNCRGEEISSLFDVVVIGSDQVWNPEITLDDESLFLGECLSIATPKIAYAASCGEMALRDGKLARLVEALKSFSRISVRENELAVLLRNAGLCEIKVVSDPVFLLPKEAYTAFYHCDCANEPYLYFYTVYCRNDDLEIARKVAERLNLRLIVSPARLGSRNFIPKEADPVLRPDRIVNYIAHAKCVIAASYHGTAFAAIFEKPFVSFSLRAGNGLISRPEVLLNMLGEPERIIDRNTSIDSICKMLERPLSEELKKNLNTVASNSKAWLKDAISAIRK